MDRFRDAVRTRGFKVLNPRHATFRANRLFKCEGHDTITAQVEVSIENKYGHSGWVPHASVSVYETYYWGKQPRDVYLIKGHGNSSNGQNPDFYIEFETFGSYEQDCVLRMIDDAVRVAIEQNLKHEESNALHGVPQRKRLSRRAGLAEFREERRRHAAEEKE
jgi:hypothetical protein